MTPAARQTARQWLLSRPSTWGRGSDVRAVAAYYEARQALRRGLEALSAEGERMTVAGRRLREDPGPVECLGPAMLEGRPLRGWALVRNVATGLVHTAHVDSYVAV